MTSDSFIYRVRHAFTRRKMPAWLLILVLILERVPDWKARIDFWLDVARNSGGALAPTATVLQSPYFSLALLVGATAYLIFIGEPSHGVQRHHWWPYIGWISFGICLTAIVVTAGYGAIEIYVREQVAERQATILHDGSNPRVPPQQPDLAFAFRRRLSPDQFRVLIHEAAKLKRYSTTWLITMPQSDSEAGVFRQDFLEAFTRAGIQVGYSEQRPEGPEQTGVMIPVDDISNPDPAAQELRRVLEIIGIVPTYTRKPEDFRNRYVLFIGPKPL